jgi:hypothetical protein
VPAVAAMRREAISLEEPAPMNLNRANLFYRLSLIWLALVASGFAFMLFWLFQSSPFE